MAKNIFIFAMFFFLIKQSNGFIPKNMNPFAKDYGLSHLQMTYSAMCQAGFKWLQDNGNNGRVPSTQPEGFPISTCPVDKWSFELYQYTGAWSGKPMQILKQVSESCADVDSGATKNLPEYHFDDELLAVTNTRLITSYESIVRQINQDKLSSARVQLGQFLHTMQDFYAHSNWIESGKTVVNENIGRSNSFGMPLAGPKTVTCHKNSCQDTGGTCFFGGRGRNIYSCPVSNVITDQLTTGYYQPSSTIKPPGKCSHGGCYDYTSTTDPTGGINKDTWINKYSPHFMLHNTAAHVAFKATESLLRNLRVAVGNVKFGSLLGFEKGDFAVLIDTTGSMSDSIDGAINWAKSLVETESGKGIEFMLMPFNDPGWGPLKTTKDVKQMVSWLDQLSAGGGGDIPEQCFPALLYTLENMPRGGNVVVFTDAPSHQENLYPQILAASEKKAINFIIQYMDSPDSEEPTMINNQSSNMKSRTVSDGETLSLYENLSAYTGGLFLSGGNSVENIANATSIIDVSPKNFKTYVLRQDMVTSGENWSFPIASFVSRLEIILSKPGSLDLSNFHFENPRGRDVLVNSTVVNTQGTVLLRVTTPTVGIWNFGTNSSISFPQTFSFIVRSYNSELFVPEFYIQTNDSRYPTFVQIEGNPVVGLSYLMEIRSSSATTSVIQEIDLIFCENGTVTDRIVPSTVSGISNAWLCNITVPKFPFCIQLRGTDSTGNQFLQLQQNQVMPTSIQLQANLTGNFSLSLFPGTNLTVQFTVTNLGEPQSFNLLAKESGQLLFGPVNPSSVHLAKNASANGNVYLHADDRTLPGASSIIQVTAAADSSFFETNFLTLLVTVEDPDPDLTPPNCTILNTNISSCPLLSPDGKPTASCSSAMWDATFSYFDRGSGILKVVFSNETAISWSQKPQFNTSFPNATFFTTASASCCISEASLAAVDRSGLLDRCLVAVPKSIPASPHKFPIGIIIGVLVAVVLIVVALVFAFKHFKRATNNQVSVGYHR